MILKYVPFESDMRFSLFITSIKNTSLKQRCNWHFFVLSTILLLIWFIFPANANIIRIANLAQTQAIVSACRGEIICGSTSDSLLVEFPEESDFRRFQSLVSVECYREIGDLSNLLGPIHSSSDEIDDYHTYATAASEIINFVTNHPTIAHLDTIGYSVEHRAILHLKITDSVSVDRDLPRFYILSGTHGNELIGVEITLRYLRWLDTMIETDTAMQRRLHNIELHLVPIHNPDGYEYRQRYNYRGVDLNRNFAFHWGFAAAAYGTAPLSEPEDVAIDSLVRTIQPVMSLAYHSSGMQILRPYCWYARECPDSITTRSLSVLYHNYLPFYNQIMGGQLYFHGGEHNDHNYSRYGNPGFTIETWRGPDYNPPIDSIDTVCIPHRFAINAMIDRALQNQLTGFVIDSSSRRPIANVDWQIVSQWDSGFVTRKLLPNGRYRMLREPGIYTLQFAAPDYLPRTVRIRISATGTPTVQDVALVSAYSSLRGQVAIYGDRSTDSIWVSFRQQQILLDSTHSFGFDHVTTGVDTVLIFGTGFETRIHIVALLPGDTARVHTSIARLLAPVITRRGIEEGESRFYWTSPYTDPEANRRILGYAIIRDSVNYIPLTFDTVFSEPFPDGSPPRVYQLRTIYLCGQSALTDTLLFTVPDIDNVDSRSMVDHYGFDQVYPNPFNRVVTLRYRLKPEQSAALEVFDALGRLVQRANIPIGATGAWQWMPDRTRSAAGVYFLRIIQNRQTETYKLLYLP